MLKIAQCESGFNPTIIGDSQLTSTLAYKARGLPYGESVSIFQIRLLPGRPDKEWLINVDNNISYAKALYEREGVAPWSCSRILNIN